MNLFDFDNTIYKKDSSVKFYFFCLSKKPIMFFHLIYVCFLYLFKLLGFISTKRFKEKYFTFLKYFDNIEKLVNSFWKQEKKNIAKWYLSLKKESDVICSASPEFLVKPIMQQINPKAIVICTKMNKKTAKIAGENLKGDNKKTLLNELGYTSFDNVYTDSLSDFPILDMTQNKWLVFGEKVYEFGKQKPSFKIKVKYYFKQLRIKHYLKNGLIFLPLFFGGLISNNHSIITCLLGFLAFCLMASFVYVVNDLMDVDKDRNHTTKRKRPIASYMIKKWEGVILAVILFMASLVVNYFVAGFNVFVYIILLMYTITNLLYSIWLKNLPIIDVFILALCYLIRIFYGAIILLVPISKYLYLTILSASLYMGFGKRRNEKRNENENTRKVSKGYSYNFLDKNLYICLALCLIFYSLWVMDFHVISGIYLNNKLLLGTIPLVFFILMRYSLDIEKVDNNGDPIDVLLKDKTLILVSILFVAVIVIAVYVPIPNFFLKL